MKKNPRPRLEIAGGDLPLAECCMRTVTYGGLNEFASYVCPHAGAAALRLGRPRVLFCACEPTQAITLAAWVGGFRIELVRARFYSSSNGLCITGPNGYRGQSMNEPSLVIEILSQKSSPEEITIIISLDVIVSIVIIMVPVMITLSPRRGMPVSKVLPPITSTNHSY